MQKALHHAQQLIDSALFSSFLSPDANRFGIICSFLKMNSVPFNIVRLKDKKHIVVKYSNDHYSSEFKKKTIVAHYDRVANTEAANDNSAACLQLMIFAVKVLQETKQHNIKIIFTDGEEAGANGISEQGSFMLGSALRKLKLQYEEDIFVFDLCGRGDCLVISQSGIFGRDSNKTEQLIEFHKTCCRFAEIAGLDYLSIPTPYSDNAGFIATGINAQVMTVLPKREAVHLKLNLHSSSKNVDDKLAHLIVTNTKPSPKSHFSKIIPQTWQLMHTKNDCKAMLTPEAFVLIQKFLNTILNQSYK